MLKRKSKLLALFLVLILVLSVNVGAKEVVNNIEPFKILVEVLTSEEMDGLLAEKNTRDIIGAAHLKMSISNEGNYNEPI